MLSYGITNYTFTGTYRMNIFIFTNVNYSLVFSQKEILRKNLLYFKFFKIYKTDINIHICEIEMYKYNNNIITFYINKVKIIF